MTEQHFLHHIFKSPNFSTEELEQIIPQFRKMTFSKNDYLLKEGSVSNQYWFIENGFARSFAIDTEGNEVSTNFFSIGDVVIDWSSFFLRQQTRENIQAISDCVCWQLDYEKFQHLFNSIKSFREQGRANLVESYFALKNRSTSMITDSAKDRYLKFLEEKNQIVQFMPLKYIASYLGITDTSLSRIRKEISIE